MALRRAARRGFLVRAGIVTVAALVPGLAAMSLGRAAQTREPHEPVSDEVRYGLLVDAGKCARDCDACVRAVTTSMDSSRCTGPPPIHAGSTRSPLRDHATGRISTLPLMCQHCADPPCVDVCPTGASFKRADGIVLVDKHSCIGCRYCVMACPVPGARVRA